MRRIVLFIALLISAAPFARGAKGKKAGAHGQAPSARAIGELAGKFKWGMTPNECIKLISDDVHARYAESIKKTQDIYQQDQLRKKEAEDVKAVSESYTKFEGQKSGWDTSIVDKEFVHRDGESMLVIWEKDQRRFLFFWNAKLYKQYIAFNAEHPAFAGKSFDNFAKLIQNRYGRAEMKLASMRTKDEVQLDHLEWPSSGDVTLWAIDQSGFYGNFCLKLMQTSTTAQVERSRAEKAPRQARSNAIIDAVTAPETVKGDVNADIVDQITGTKTHPAQAEPSTARTEPSPVDSTPGAAPAPKKKAPTNTGNDDPLAGMKF